MLRRTCKITFQDVAGIDEAVAELREVVDFLKTPEKYQALGGRIPKGVLLVGPPGTGKTLLAKAVAGEAEVPFFSMSGSDFVEMFVGVGAARVRDLFGQAESQAPCIIFIDELDALGKTRGGTAASAATTSANRRSTSSSSRWTASTPIAASSSWRRPTGPRRSTPPCCGPADSTAPWSSIGPTSMGREAILKVHVRNVKLADDVDLRHVASLTPGSVGADLANLVNEAALMAARSGKEAVDMAEFDEAIERGAVGLERKSRIMHADEKQRVAYHEAGHALVACALPNTHPVHKVSIIPRGVGALGYVLQPARGGPLPDDAVGAGEPHQGRPGRHAGRGAGLPRNLQRRHQRPGEGEPDRPPHGQGVRHEPAGPRLLPRAGSGPAFLARRRHRQGDAITASRRPARSICEVRKIIDDATEEVRAILHRAAGRRWRRWPSA